MKHTEADHLLIRLAEECAEVQQRITKALTYGLTEKQPGQGLDNNERLALELDDLFGVHEMLLHRSVIRRPNLQNIDAKVLKVVTHMAYARQIGELV